jgi:hypothetical protein
LCELPTQRVGRDEVDEGLLTVDLDDRDQLAIPRLQLGIPVDRDLLQLETELVARSDDRLARLLAQMAPRGAVQPDQRRYG